ncbi:hypothetical protein BH09VER1_BH09VER1_37830 [soil metagenome]
MAKRLSVRETKRVIRGLGIDRQPGEAFGLFDMGKNVRYAFHRHTRHQLMFPSARVLFVEAGPNYCACTPELGAGAAQRAKRAHDAAEISKGTRDGAGAVFAAGAFDACNAVVDRGGNANDHGDRTGGGVLES